MNVTSGLKAENKIKMKSTEPVNDSKQVMLKRETVGMFTTRRRKAQNKMKREELNMEAKIKKSKTNKIGASSDYKLRLRREK